MKIVFSDLDGTLLATDKTVSQQTWAALDELAARGIEFVPCSGRPLGGIDKHIIAHPAVHYVVGSNGAVVYRVEKGAIGEDGLPEITYEVLRRVDMDPEAVTWLYSKVKHLDILFDVLADGNCYSERPRYERMDTYNIDPYGLASFKAMRTPIDITEDELVKQVEHIERVTVYWHTQEECQTVKDYVDARPDIIWVNSLPINLEISDKNATKGSALLWLCEYLGISPQDATAFGDGINDISMIEAAGDGVAMQNAESEVFEVANHVALDNDAPGVARYLGQTLGF